MIYVHLAEGFEEIEAITVTDILRRAGATVNLVSVSEETEVTGAHGIKVKADIKFSEADYDGCEMIVLPGGMPGTVNLMEHTGLMQRVREAAAKGRWVCAICAAPMILAKEGITDGRRATIYPGMEEHLAGAVPEQKAVVRDGNIITSQAPGTATKFAIALVEALFGREEAERIEKDELCC